MFNIHGQIAILYGRLYTTISRYLQNLLYAIDSILHPVASAQVETLNTCLKGTTHEGMEPGKKFS